MLHATGSGSMLQRRPSCLTGLIASRHRYTLPTLPWEQCPILFVFVLVLVMASVIATTSPPQFPYALIHGTKKQYKSDVHVHTIIHQNMNGTSNLPKLLACLALGTQGYMYMYCSLPHVIAHPCLIAQPPMTYYSGVDQSVWSALSILGPWLVSTRELTWDTYMELSTCTLLLHYQLWNTASGCIKEIFLQVVVYITESVDSVCRDGTDMPYVAIQTEA